MIGRSDELDQLARALARATAGTATAVVVSGEAGIGKTRLVHEFVAGAAHGVRVIRGGCIPLTDGLQPFAPIIDILRVLGPALGPQAALLNGLLPELTPDRAAGDVDQPRLFAALRQVLERVAEADPLIVVLEDLHWADPSTLALLAYLAHAARSGMGRLLLIGTCRAELPDLHPLRTLLTELDRGGAIRLELDRLAPAQTAAQIAGILDAPADPDFAESLHARCGGNPFLIEELLAVGPQTDPLPQGTRDILLQRVRPLDPDDRHLLLALALAGGRADHRLLAQVIGWSHELLAPRLRNAVERHLLVAQSEGYAFRHALVAEALVSEALPHERIQLHRAYASVLGPVATAAEIAHHWCRAADPVRALHACIEAGLAAERLYAQSEARQHFDRAIDLWTEASHSPLDFVDLCLHGAEAAYLSGDSGHAIDLIRRALLDAGADGRLYERLGRYLWANGDAEAESIGAYERAVELSTQKADRARALTGLAAALTYADRPEAPIWCDHALRLARAAGARREEGRALQTLGYCEAMAGQVERGLMHCREALAMAVKLDHSEDLYRAYSNIVGVLRMAGRTAEAAATGLEGAEVARRRGAERTYGNLLLGDAIDALILLGRWDEAEALLPDEPDVVAHGTPVIATNLWLSAANLHTWRGHFDQSRIFLDACMAAYAKRGHGHVRSMLHANLSELCIWQGNFAEASHWISTELDLLGQCEFTSLLSRLVFQGLRAEAGLARHNDLTRLVDLLEEMSQRADPPPDAAALIVTCWAELSRVHGSSEADRWVGAADQWVKLDMPWPLAYSRWRQAEVLLTGRPDPAQRQAGAAALIDAYTVAARIGATPMVDEIVALARRTRLATKLPAASPTATPTSKLTDREAEVLDLICAGATNRRIAQQLFISEKTVSVHVSSILAKLGAANRGEAAAVTRRAL